MGVTLIQWVAAARQRLSASVLRANDSRQMVVKAGRVQVRDSENAEYNRNTRNSLSMARSGANRTPACLNLNSCNAI